MRPIIAVPATCLLIVRAWRKNSLTPAGLVAATATAIAHAYHPWNLPFALLCIFFLAGTRVTHVKEDVKAKLTLSAGGTPGGEGPRTHIQVFANSLMASIFSVLHAIQLNKRKELLVSPVHAEPTGSLCFAWGGDLLVIGIIANYAAVAADTFSSELGILSRSEPRLITSLTLRKVPRGTNGGVTLTGLLAGLLGSVIIVTASILFLPVCTENTLLLPGSGPPFTFEHRRAFMSFLVVWGGLGSVLDSFLGGILQRSVRDARTGKIVEGEGGSRVLVASSAAFAGASSQEVKARAMKKTAGKNEQRVTSSGEDRPSRVVETGYDLLDNNGVNLLMAASMSIGGMVAAGWYWEVPLQSIFSV